MVNIEHKQTRVIVTFTGSVTEGSIIELVGTIDRLQTDYFYQKVDLQIASPGGELIALDYFIEAISSWKQQGLTVTTRALTACRSAAAIMLSLGDHREASTSSVLHYHHSRILGEQGPITSDSAEEVSERLKSVDNRMLAKVVDQVVKCGVSGDCASASVLDEADRIALKEVRMEWCRQTDERPDDEDDLVWLDSWLSRTRETHVEVELRDRWSKLYDALFEQDMPISATLAARFGLIDRLIEPTARRWLGESARGSGKHWIEIPEWKVAFPDGKLYERHLRRHTLVLGETGSGKTKSAVLPVLAAAYRSPRVGVGLVIDPKRELGGLLAMWDKSERRERAGKNLIWIEKGRHVIDLMENDAWSIRGMIERNEYWGAAQQILRRIAGLTESNPARILLGEPPASIDSYWPQEGTSLSSTVVGLAIEFMTHPENYVGPEMGVMEADGENRMLSVATARLYAIGVRLGVFKDRREEYVREAEESREVDRREGLPFFHEHDFNQNRYDFDGEYPDFEGEGSDPEKIRRDSAIRILGKNLKSGRVFPKEEKLIEWMLERWSDSEMSMDDFDAALREVRSGILVESRDGKVPNVLLVASAICNELFSIVESEKVGRENSFGGTSSSFTPLHALADFIMTKEGGVAGEFDLIAKHMKKYADMREGADRQYAGVYGVATTVWREFISSEIGNSLYFGCEARSHCSKSGPELDFLKFKKEVGRSQEDIEKEPGSFYVYQPALNGSDILYARACKALYFEAILGDEKRTVKGEEMPSAAYIADEFQRFITVDREHGEQSFLDVCRSFGAFTVIACQSVASLHYALCEFERDDSKRRSAIDIICNNTATKLFFRNSDKDTSDRLDTICPGMPGGDVVTRVRPLSTLGVGECYASFPDGRFVRIQLDEFGGGGEPGPRVDSSGDAHHLRADSDSQEGTPSGVTVAAGAGAM